MATKTIYFLIIAGIFASTESMNRGDFMSITTAPYFVSIMSSKMPIPYCGGAIISENWILTAAHCMTASRVSPLLVPIAVRTGSSTRTSNGDIHEVEKVFIYGDVESIAKISEKSVGYNDIALLKLKTPIVFNEYKQPIRVNSKLPNELGNVTVIGIGKENIKEKTSASLKTAIFKPSPELMEVINKTIPSVFVIQGIGPEVCPGDSGSPAVFDGELIGVLSGGPLCADWKRPKDSFYMGAAIYTRVDMFYDWIMQLTAIKY